MLLKEVFMSQEMKKTPSEQGYSGRTPREYHERKHADGFEGMNYEQRRPSYQPGQQAASLRRQEPGTREDQKKDPLHSLLRVPQKPR